MKVFPEFHSKLWFFTSDVSTLPEWNPSQSPLMAKSVRNWNFMTLLLLLFQARTIFISSFMPRHFYDFPALFKASEKCCFRTLPWSKAKHVAMGTYHELIQLHRKLLPLIKFLDFMLLNISLPHHQVIEPAPVQLIETFIVDLGRENLVTIKLFVKFHRSVEFALWKTDWLLDWIHLYI